MDAILPSRSFEGLARRSRVSLSRAPLLAALEEFAQPLDGASARSGRRCHASSDRGSARSPPSPRSPRTRRLAVERSQEIGKVLGHGIDLGRSRADSSRPGAPGQRSCVLPGWRARRPRPLPRGVLPRRGRGGVGAGRSSRGACWTELPTELGKAQASAPRWLRTQRGTQSPSRMSRTRSAPTMVLGTLWGVFAATLCRISGEFSWSRRSSRIAACAGAAVVS